MNNHRTENRIIARVTGKATILGHPDYSVRCVVENFSRSGICITVGLHVPSGQIVKVEWSDHFLVGRAQRVTGVGEKFRVGLELLYCSKWGDSVNQMFALADERPLHDASHSRIH